MTMGAYGWTMKNNVKISQFPCKITTLIDGSQRVTFDVFDFVGTRGIKRREWKRLFLIKKKFPVTKVFRYSADWDTLTDGGCISYWDQTTQAQVPAYALMNEKMYTKVIENQKRAADVLYYCLAADDLIDKLMTPPNAISAWDVVIPSLLIGGIVLTAVMNVYAASQYIQAYGLVKGVSGNLSTLQNYFQGVAGVQFIIPRLLLPLPTHLMIPSLFGIALARQAPKPKAPQPQTAVATDKADVIVRDGGLVIRQLTTATYSEPYVEKAGDQPRNREFIIIPEGKRRFKIYINQDEKHALRGTRNNTVYMQYKKGDSARYRQLTLEEMGMDPVKAKPINEDMGKVLAKIYQDNINAKKKPQNVVEALTKVLFYAFIFSTLVYAAMYGVNIWLLYQAISAWGATTSALNLFLAHAQYVVSPVGNTVNTIANSLTTNAV